MVKGFFYAAHNFESKFHLFWTEVVSANMAMG
jgi:hypothetical protein